MVLVIITADNQVSEKVLGSGTCDRTDEWSMVRSPHDQD